MCEWMLSSIIRRNCVNELQDGAGERLKAKKPIINKSLYEKDKTYLLQWKPDFSKI